MANQIAVDKSRELFTVFIDQSSVVGRRVVAFRKLINDYGIERFADLLEEKNISSLDLSQYNSFSDKQIKTLSEALKKKHQFVHLNLHSCKVRGVAMPCLVPGFARLQRIDLNSNRLGDMGARILANFLKTDPPLTHLFVQDNCIGIRGGEDLGEALAQNTQLQVLDLYQNQLESAGALSIFEGIISNQTLTDLNLDDNGVDAKDMPQIALLVSKNSSLTRFNGRAVNHQERQKIVKFFNSQTMTD